MGDLPSEGLHDSIDEQAYHADPRSLSSTGAKTILTQGLRAFQWKREHPEHKAAFDLGSVVHALMLGVGDFEVIDADSWRTKDAKAAQQAAYDAGRTPILTKDHATAVDMRDAVLSNKLAEGIFSEGRPEVSAWAEDPETGILMRGRIDWLRDNAIVDVKTSAKPVDPMEWERTAWNFRYGLQAYWYSRLLELNGEPERPFLWVAISTSAPYEVYVHQASAEMLDKGREDAEDVLCQYGDALLTGKWPGLADADQIHLTGLPRWAR
ncbi:PD-(D/E)XK nuclease-like domain-containing protein [Brachybacterium halotolerans subsp. kimchii]|uniref:PD-(D/E)XK nuclease-like domain-containing protein n=1 Tax=Brachybacterium halotolerans TaxID=2795215 RepID=UPI001E464E82|nr:PD-(D/E)XK nuclease-like domain-containing protein [Brachybacterium halotolerans]UEJ83960.1 PD-(D/E)XK nuclease-like domain-containing protein [Brachybacterium halotolerans subsp. kimchii]